jgi:hypothetical protein
VALDLAVFMNIDDDEDPADDPDLVDGGDDGEMSMLIRK